MKLESVLMSDTLNESDYSGLRSLGVGSLNNWRPDKGVWHKSKREEPVQAR